VDSPAARRTTGILGIAALVGIAVTAWLSPVDAAATFPGALLAASALTAVAIVAGVWPGSWFGPAIDVRPLRWIGDRSYGIYLWHWPLLVLWTAAVPGASLASDTVPVWIGFAVLAATLAAAELSYRFVETPVRRLGFRASLSRLAGQFRAGAGSRTRAIAAVAAGILVLGGTSAAIAAAPAESSGQSLVEAGQDALDQANTAAPSPAATATPSVASPSPEPSRTGAAPAPGAPAPARPSPTPSPTPVGGAEITAVGDSVMLASVPALFERLPGIQIDAAVSRSSWAGPGILEHLAATGQLRRYVVVALGTNGPIDAASLERMAEIVGPDRELVLVNAYAPRDWIPGVNAHLAEFAKTHSGVVVADWSAAIGGRADLLAGDEIHPSTGGAQVFAETVAAAVESIEQTRAQKQYELELRRYENLRHRRLPIAE
jgi:lysophospholipase L1-like esterase